MVEFVIIEDQQMVCEMLAEFIGRRLPRLYLAGTAADADEGLALCRRVQPQLALIDIRIPGTDGVEVARLLLEEQPDLRVLVISGECSPYNCYRIAHSGICGFVDKTRPLSELQEAIETVLEGGVWFSESYDRVRREYGKSPDAFYKILSRREQEVLLRVAHGDTDEEIARRLDIRPRTVETHRYNITKKLGLSDTSALRKYAVRQGMWSPGPDAAS